MSGVVWCQCRDEDVPNGTYMSLKRMQALIAVVQAGVIGMPSELGAVR